MRLLFKNGRSSSFTLSSTGWIVLTFSIFYLLSVRYFHYVSSRDPTSYFFDPRHAYERRYSTVRVQEAEAFINAVTDAPLPQTTSGESPYMCVGIATVARRGDQYVHLTVGSILAGLSTNERKDVFLALLIGHTDPSKHPDASKAWLERLPNKVLTYNSDDPHFTQIKAWEEGGWYRNKTIFDYTYLLRQCYDTGAQYITVLEDDTIAMQGWFARAQTALRDVELAMKRKAQNQRWIYLRLFYSDDLLGWNSEEWPTYLFWSIAIWGSVTGVLLVLKRRFGRKLDTHVTDTSVISIATLCISLLITLHFMAGRHTTHPLRAGIHEMNKYGCCSQGLVFPRSIVPDLLDRTDLTTDWLVDMMIEKIADQEDWTRWATVPPLLQHIGATSSKGYGFDDSAKKLWSFRFEEWYS